MEYRRLGKSGLVVSQLSFGSWVTFGNQVDNKTAEECMHLAYDGGINFFDNAETYADGKSEEVMGEILKKANWRRDSYLVSSKAFFGAGARVPNQYGLSAKHLTEACHEALKRLQVEYLDLYFCHRPDLNTPVEETVRAMHNLITQGKILYWGTSEWSASQIMEAYSIARQYGLTPPTMEQPQYNMFERDKVEADYTKLYDVIGLGTTIWSPLASGFLTGKYNSGSAPKGSRIGSQGMEWLKERWLGDGLEKRIEKVKKLMELASQLDVTMPQLAISWCLKNKNVSTVILGASNSNQLKENLLAANAYPKLTAEVMESIEEILANKPK